MDINHSAIMIGTNCECKSFNFSSYSSEFAMRSEFFRSIVCCSNLLMAALSSSSSKSLSFIPSLQPSFASSESSEDESKSLSIVEDKSESSSVITMNSSELDKSDDAEFSFLFSSISDTDGDGGVDETESLSVALTVVEDEYDELLFEQESFSEFDVVDAEKPELDEVEDAESHSLDDDDM